MKKMMTQKSDNKEILIQLHSEIAQCQLCEDKFGFKPHPILFGNCNAKIMQISQAPSKKVHETGRPFHDASGKKLRNEWYQITDEEFYNPDYFYIVSMAHCYPGKALKGGDRHPPKICSTTWLQREMELVENEIYIIIGGIAADYFFPGEKISDLAFKDKKINGKPAYILPHPSPLNMKWFKDYPEFETQRLPVIRKEVHRYIKKAKERSFYL